MKFLWLIGDDVPDEFFNCESLDYREPIRSHCNLDFDQNANGGAILRALPWQAPDDLFMDSPVLIRD